MSISRRETMRHLAACWRCRDHPQTLMNEARTALCAIATDPTAANFENGAILVAFLQRWWRMLNRAYLEDRFIEISTIGQANSNYSPDELSSADNRLATRAAVRTLLIDFLTEVGIVSIGPGWIVVEYFIPLTHSQMVNR